MQPYPIGSINRNLCYQAFVLGITGMILFWFSLGQALAEQDVSLSWDPSPSGGVAGYTVRFGTTSGTYSDFLVAGLSTSATVPDLVEGTTYYFIVTAYTLTGLESDPSNELVYTVPDGTPSGNPPTLDALGNMTIAEDSPIQTVLLSGITVGLGGILNQLGLGVTAASSNPSLIPHPTVTYNSPGTAGTIRFAPNANASGTAIITVTVANNLFPNNIFSRAFTVTVNPVNDPPAINVINNLTLTSNAGPQTVPLTGISAGTGDEGQTLTLTARSSNTSLIPHPALSYASPNSTGNLVITPAPNSSGTASITVTVHDGQSQDNTATITFNVVVGSTSISTIYMEAEHGDLTAPMSIAPDVEASGGQFVRTPTAEGGTLSLTFNVNQPGNYVVWCRVLSPNVDRDSFYASMDGGIADTYFTGSNSWSSAWQWSQLNGINFGNPRIFTLSEGNHTLLLRGRESNTYLDALYITNDRGFVPSDNTANASPTLSAIGNLTIKEDSGQQTITLTGISSGSVNENQTITISATSNNPDLISSPVINYDSPNTMGTLTFVPALEASGTAEISVSVNDGQAANNLVTRTFIVTVTPENDAPTLDNLPSMSLDQEAGPQKVILSGITSGAANELQPLIVSASSSDSGLVSYHSVNYSSPNSTAVLTFAPVANAVGTVTISVTVNDGQASNNLITRSFDVTINASSASPLAFYLEAEAGDLTNPMIVAASSEASNGSYVYSPANEKGAVTFNFDAAESGDYMIWCRVLSAHSAADSFYVSVDGQSEEIFRTAPNSWSPGWHWSRINNQADPETAMTFPLSAGSHTLRLRARESATQLDVVYITKSPGFVPINLSIARATPPNRGVNLKFQSVAGYRYTIEATEDLHAWTSLWSSEVTTVSQLLSHLDTSTTASGKRFYRVRILQ